MPPSWRTEYLDSLRANDEELQKAVNSDLVETCSQLTDLVSSLKADNAALLGSARPPTNPASARDEEKAPRPAPAPDADDADKLKLRADLASALRARTALETRVRALADEAERLRGQHAADARQLRQLGAERATLGRKVGDRDEELRAKRHLLESLQDELAVVTMEVTVATEKRRAAEAENRDLTARLVALKKRVEALDMADAGP